MGGSGGGGYSGSGYTGGGGIDSSGSGGGSGRDGGGNSNFCIFNTAATIASPNASVLANVSVGHILSVGLNSSGASPVVEVITSTGAVLGSLAGLPRLSDLIACIQRGVNYQFVIAKITGGRVEGRLGNA